MSKTLHLTVRTPEAEVVNLSNVTSLKVATEKGIVKILPGHADLVGTISFSKMVVGTAESELEYIVQQGMLFVSLEEKKVQVLAYQCKKLQDIEYKSAREYLDFIEEQLKSGADLNDFQMKYLENEKIAMVQQIAMVEGK